MTGEKLDGVLHRVASSFEKSSYGDVNGVHVPRLAVGFREDWTIDHGETKDTFYGGGFHSFSTRYPPARGEDPSRNVIRFPVTEVPVSTTVALYNRVLRGLRGRMSSGPP